jgi:hypothetical protein
MMKLTGARSGKELWLAPQHVTAVQPGVYPLYNDDGKVIGEKLCTYVVTMNDEEAWEVSEAPAAIVAMVEEALA